jgi:hypothetical protein
VLARKARLSQEPVADPYFPRSFLLFGRSKLPAGYPNTLSAFRACPPSAHHPIAARTKVEELTGDFSGSFIGSFT